MHTTDSLRDVLHLLLQIAAQLRQNFLLITTAYFWSVKHKKGSSYKQSRPQMRAGCRGWLSGWAVSVQKQRWVTGQQSHQRLGGVKISALTTALGLLIWLLKQQEQDCQGKKLLFLRDLKSGSIVDYN